MVAITASGEIHMDGRAIDRRAVRANVERMHAENPEGAVIIQADKDAKTGILIEVMDQARLAGVANVSIAAERN
jgi:biopolymer transport protein ExbD